MYIVTIHTGPYYTDLVARAYRAVGSLDQVIAGARARCNKLYSTRGRRVLVSFDDDAGKPITSRVMKGR